MKIKLNWIQELRGASGVNIWGDKSCYQVRPGGVQILMRNPGGPRPATGRQAVYRHQILVIRNRWRRESEASKKAYDDEGKEKQMAGVNAYIAAKYPMGHLGVNLDSDVYVYKQYPNENFNHHDEVILDSTTTYQKNGLFEFRLSVIPKNFSFSSAELRCFYRSDHWYPAAGQRLDCFKIMDKWQEGDVTWNTKPTLAGTETDNTTAPAVGNWFTFDVTADVNAFLAGTSIFYGWCVLFHTIAPTGQKVVAMDDRARLDLNQSAELWLYD